MALGAPNNIVDGGTDLGLGASAVFSSGAVNPGSQLDPTKYTTIGTLIGEYAKPDVREQLIATYGDQGITGFLKLTGAVNAAATQDEVTYYEEGRRHRIITITAGNGALVAGTKTGLTVANAEELPQHYDILMDVATGVKYIVTDDPNRTAKTFAVDHLTDSTATNTIGAGAEFITLGNMYPQGSRQPKQYEEPGLVKRVNPFMIIKDRFQVTGSAATNIGYVNLGNGDYRWYLKGEQDTRARFEDRREMMMLFAEAADAVGETDIAGSEGYFSALEDRGIVQSGLYANPFSAMSEIDAIIKELDKEGAPSEYAMYLNRTQDLAIDDLLANGIATQVTAGLSGQFGAFNNSPDMAVKLGFKSFTRGGYTFHKHDWKLLNDPTLVGAMENANGYQGAMVPMTQVVDPKTGTKAPSLEMNYKAANGYSREMEHWVTGGGVLGFNNNGDAGEDVATFHYRSEINLITRAANQHVLLKG